MPRSIRLILALHNHQPVGNFDGVFEAAYQDSYRPFLDVLERYDSLPIALHVSGSLMQWLDARHREYVDRLAELVRAGRIEIIGGAFFEPILAMIPSHDRQGQIRAYTAWLKDRLGANVRGMWVAERVWEQGCVRDLVDAGIEYTILDDFHFKCAGLTDEQLTGHFLTEDEGRLLAVFPGSERLRYTIPFAAPQATIDHLAAIAQRHENAVVVFGDDGEKFGTWPETKKHVYDDGWLVRFFDALMANRDWIRLTTPSEALDHVPPAGKVYLPDCSYREMTEWALPAEQLAEYDEIAHELKDHPAFARLRRFVRGGFWRNFKVKYPEADEMYARMMAVSRRLQGALETEHPDARVEQARTELYRAQCNCGWWHGAFGGIYLPHLRNAIYHHLILADNLLEQAVGRCEPWVEAVADDFNFDARQEVRLANDRLAAWLAPARGGQMYELDVRAIGHNLLATMTRRPEAYHRKVLAGATQDNGQVASIHDRVVFKQPDLDKRLQYDDHPRKSLLDLFYDPSSATLEAVAAGKAAAEMSFVDGAYEARVRRNPGRIQVQMRREGTAFGAPLKLTKGVTLEAGSATLEIAYLIERLPPGRKFLLAVELGFAGMPAGADDRFFRAADGSRLGQLGQRLDLADARGLRLVDEWLGLEVGIECSRPTGFWTFPVESISGSEGGFELVHQSVVVLPHWLVEADAQGRWSVTFELSLDTAAAESRREPALAAAAS